MDMVNISQKSCYIFSHKTNKDGVQYCIYLGVGSQGINTVRQMFEYVEGGVKDKSYMIIAFESSDWNRDFSPWEAPPAFGREGFTGGASETLSWLKDECIPYAEKKYLQGSNVKNFIAGYSLAGLFSLWVFYTSGIFNGAASISGSLWFPGWMEFARKSAAPKESIVYLSLGNKEEHIKNKVMARIGDATREMDELLERDGNVVKHTLEWNVGGHFNEPEMRTAKGISWLLTEAF